MIRRSKPVISATPPLAPWSQEAIAAYDAAALGRNLPAIVASNLRRKERRNLRGIFDIYVPAWGLTVRGCYWFENKRGEWVKLPIQQWTDESGVTHREPVVLFDQVHAKRFEDSMLEALHCLLLRAAVTAPVDQVDTKITSENDDAPQQMNGAVLDLDDIPF